VLQYYYILRSVLRANPHLKECLTKCKHCRIFFLTHPRNAGRDDLRCPFGCRDAHRKESSNKRSAEWYRSKRGKEKKKDLNERRFRQTSFDNSSEDLAKEESVEHKEEVVRDEPEVIQDEPEVVQYESEVVRNKTTLCYIQMLIGLIEGRLVSLDEVLEMLLKIVRQHSIDRRRRFVYAFTYPEQKPP